MSRTLASILKKNNRVVAEKEQTDQDKNIDQDEDDVASGEEPLGNSVVIGTEKQRPHGNQDERFIERARTHLAHEIDVTWASKHTSENIVKEMKSKYDKLEDLFNGTERQVLYRVNHLIHQRIDLNTNVSNESGDGILHIAVKKKFVKVAERLLDNGAHLNSRNKDGYTPLHLALGCCNRKKSSEETEKTCSCSWFESIQKYVKTNFGKDDEDRERNTNQDAKCDEMAALIISKLKPCYLRNLFGDDTYFRDRYQMISRNGPAKTRFPCHRMLLNQGLHFGSFNFLDIIKDKDLQTTASIILDKLEDTDPLTKKPVVYYTLLTKDKTETDGIDNNEEEVFQYIARRRPELIKHPVVRAVIHWKWKRKFHRRYLFDFFKFFLSFIAITICAVVGAQSDGVHVYDSPWQYTRAALEILTCIFIFDTFQSELLQFYIDPKGYVRSLLNWMEVVSAVCLTVSIGLRYSDVNAHWYLFAVGYVFWTVKGLKYCAIHRHADAYKETLRELIKRDLFLFTVFFVALEMLFGGTLLLVLRGTNSLNVEPDTKSILSIYYIGLRTMIDGSTPESLNVENLPRVGEFVIIVFNSLTIVIMLNILIAQLSNTYETAYLDGQIKSWVNRAEAIVSYEKEDGCKPFGGIRLFRWYCKHSHIPSGKISFDKEKLLEEKEKLDEMRAILKQVDNTLLHTDLSVQTVKTKQTALLQAKKGTPESLTNDSQDQSGLRRDFNKLATQLSEVKAQQDSILEAVGEIRKLLQKQE